MVAEQFTETQQKYVDLRRVIERTRAERVTFDVHTEQSEALEASSSEDLLVERVRSEISELDPDVVVFNRGTFAYYRAIQMQYVMSQMKLM
jgi:hypothetical protein